MMVSCTESRSTSMQCIPLYPPLSIQCFESDILVPQWSSGNTLVSRPRDQSSNPGLTLCGKAGSC